MKHPAVYIGFDPREADAFAVARHSMRRRMTLPIPIRGLVLAELQAAGLYTRPTLRVEGRMIDLLSQRADYDGSISTEHANARFLVPHLNRTGHALFVDGDILVRGNVEDLFGKAQNDLSKAAWCVKHDHRPTATVKMDGQAQTVYARKNWTSVILWNCDHPAMRRLTVEMVNTLPGRDLHALTWLADDEIGELDVSWNWLAGYSDPDVVPDLVHFTSGTPSMPGHDQAPFADEWRAELARWAAG